MIIFFINIKLEKSFLIFFLNFTKSKFLFLNDLHFFTNGQFLQLGLTGLQISAPNSIKA